MTSVTTTRNITVTPAAGPITPGPLTVDFTFSPTTVEVGQAVNFVGVASGGKPPYTFSWDFGDGSAFVGQRPTYIYRVAAAYVVSLTVTDSEVPPIVIPPAPFNFTVSVVPEFAQIVEGNSVSPSPTVTVTNTSELPGNLVTLTAAFVPTGVTVGFTPSSGTPAAGASVTMAMSVTSTIAAVPGVYQIQVIGTESVNGTKPPIVKSDILALSITAAPPGFFVDFAHSPTTPIVGQVVTFTATPTGGTAPFTYVWNFGDNTGNQTGNPKTHTYTTSGLFTVTLTATDNLSQVSVKTQQINVPNASIPPPSGRNPILQPFASNSIWNLPIGASATYVAANVKAPSQSGGLFNDYDVIVLKPTAPLTDVYLNTDDWSGASRCAAQGAVQFTVPIPPDFLIAGAAPGNTPNSAAAFLKADGHTLIQGQPFTRCSAASVATIHYHDSPGTEDLFGTGVTGFHGGSHLSSLGGAIRLGELQPGSVIRHALKIGLYGQENYYRYDVSDNPTGFRWPAVSADAAYKTSYQGTTSALKLGALLALAPAFDITTLETEPGKIIAQALKDYGAYTADDSAWSVINLMTERSPDGDVATEFLSTWGFSMFPTNKSNGWSRDWDKIAVNLKVVDNWTQANYSTVAASAGTLGVGGGAPRVPWAPALSGPAPPPEQPPTTVPTAPLSLSAVPGNLQNSLSWQAPSSNGNSPITNYKIYRSTGSGASVNAKVVDFATGTGTVGTNIAVTGVGFQPQLVMFYWSGDTGTTNTSAAGDYKMGVGFAVSATQRRCNAYRGAHNVATTDSQTTHRDDACMALFTGASIDGRLDFVSMDADGFTVTVDDQFTASYRVFALCISGIDEATTGAFQEPAVTGNQDITVGFQPDFVFFMARDSTSAPPGQGGDAHLSIGWAASNGQGVFMGGEEGGVAAPSVASRYSYDTECIMLMNTLTRSIQARASFVSFLSTGFRLNWLERNSSRWVQYLAVRGGQWKVGNLQTRTDGTNIVVSGLGMTPKAVMFGSTGRAKSTTDVADVDNKLSFGAATSATNRAVVSARELDNQNPTVCSHGMQFDELYMRLGTADAGTVEGLMDLVSMNSDGFTTVMDNTDPDAAFVSYAAVGGAGTAGETLIATLSNVLTYTDTGLVNGTLYNYRVSAVNGVGESTKSNQASATPTASNTPPSAPLNLKARQAGTGGIQHVLVWDAPASNGGSAVTGYNIYSSSQSGTETFWTPVGNVLTYTDETITRFYYKVTAVNAVGESPLSNEAFAAAPPSSPAAFDQIVVIAFENKNQNEVYKNSNAPYINANFATKSVLTHWRSSTNPSQPNYIDVIGGSMFGVIGDGNHPNINAPTIVDIIERSGRTWKAIAEDATGTGANIKPPRGEDHFPFLSYTTIKNNLARAQHMIPGDSNTVIAQFNAGINFIWFTPNETHNMHSASVATSDTWLSTWMPALLSAMSGKRALVLLWWDEAYTNPAYIPLFFAGPSAQTGLVSTVEYNHDSLLKLLESRWGGGDLGQGDVTAADPSEVVVLFVP